MAPPNISANLSQLQAHLNDGEIDVVDNSHETEASLARTEKEKLFTIAQRHHRNGELASALTQLEKLLALSRNVPSSCSPDRENVFETYYADLRNERDRIDQSCTEATLALAENNFEKALAICDTLQSRYPHNQEFQALRLKAQQAQRQQLLAYMGEVARSVEAEPNLDGRVYLLQEAVKRYPNEELLARQFTLACEQRDLAASIVAKARAYEAQGQFAGAIDQWKTLLSIDPHYPGLAAEIQQLEQRRQQDAEAAKLNPDRSSVQEVPKFAPKANRKKSRQPALLEAGSSIPAPQPTKLFLDDDFPESSRASRPTAPQPPQPSAGPAILQQFSEIGSVLVYNIKTRLLDSNWAPHLQKLSVVSRIPLTARQIRGFMFAVLGTLIPLLLLSFAYRSVSSRPHVPKPTPTPEATISPAPLAPPVTLPAAPSYATVAPDADPDATTTPPLQPVSPPPPSDSAPVDPIIDRPAAAHPKRPMAIKESAPSNRHSGTTATAPLPARFIISSGTPGANVIVDDVNIGELDEKGNFAYAAIAPGTHKIELSKPGHSARTFYGQAFLPGKTFDLPGIKQLSADTPQLAAKPVTIKVQTDQPAAVSFDSKPSPGTVVPQNTELVNPDEAVKTDGRWYHGRTHKYIRLATTSPTNTLLFSKEFKGKKTSWRVNLNGNTITYTLDAKGISIEKHIDAHDSTERIKTDLSNAATPSESYAVTVKLEKNDVIIARPDGTPLHTTHTGDHDWSQAEIFAKGDTYFSLSPGR